MEITLFFRKNVIGKPSIYRSFEPFINKIGKENNVRVLFLPYDGGRPWNILRNLWFVLKNRNKKGINHVTGETHYAILGLIGVPSILTIHDDYQVRNYKKGSFHRFYRWLFWIYLPIKFASKVVCISPTTVQRISELYKGLKSSIIVHHDMSSDFPYYEKEFNRSNPVILQIGTAANKNLETTLRAIEGLKCELHVIKPMSKQQHRLAKELNINYTNLYDLSNKEVYDEYKNADLVVFPSLYEGLGMPILKAQLVGRPVITTNKDPMKWVAGNNGALLLQDPLDYREFRKKIELIISDHDLRDNLIKNGKENTKRFSIDKSVIEYLKLYNQALKSK